MTAAQFYPHHECDFPDDASSTITCRKCGKLFHLSDKDVRQKLKDAVCPESLLHRVTLGDVSEVTTIADTKIRYKTHL